MLDEQSWFLSRRAERYETSACEADFYRANCSPSFWQITNSVSHLPRWISFVKWNSLVTIARCLNSRNLQWLTKKEITIQWELKKWNAMNSSGRKTQTQERLNEKHKKELTIQNYLFISLINYQTKTRLKLWNNINKQYYSFIKLKSIKSILLFLWDKNYATTTSFTFSFFFIYIYIHIELHAKIISYRNHLFIYS